MNRVPLVEDKIGQAAAQRQARVVVNFQANTAPFRDIQAEKATSKCRSDSSSSSSSSPSTSDAESYSGDRKASAKNSAAWKPADRPKRPLSAYNLFFQSERQRILRGTSHGEETPDDDAAANTILLQKILSRSRGQGGRHKKPAKKREHVKTHGKIGFVQLAKTVGAKWKGLDDASRAVYTALAAVEKTRYRKEVDLWNRRRFVDAELELAKTEVAAKQQQTLHMERVIQEGSRGIFVDGRVVEGTTLSCSTDRLRINRLGTPPPAARSIPGSGVFVPSALPLTMSHAELMAKCRAELAANMSSSALTEKETAQHHPAIMGLQHEEATEYGTVHSSMHMRTNNDAAAMTTSSSKLHAEREEVMRQSAATTVYEAPPPNNASLLPRPAACVSRNRIQNSIVCDDELDQFLSQTHICEDLGHPSFASVDREMTDFLNWAFQDVE